jgi:signal transduction histidine kinase
VVVLTVENEGNIALDMLPHVFEPFRSGQRDSGHQDGLGLGLGLYIVQQIVHAHQGSVDVQSGQAAHTVFRVKVPRRIREIMKL